MAANRKWLWRILAAVAGLVLVFAALVITIINSEIGTRWVIDQIGRRTPGEIRIDNFAGTLWTGLTIPSASYRDADREVTARGLAIGIDWSQLSLSRITLSEVSADAVVYRSLAVEIPQRKPLQLAMKPIPLTLGAARLDVREFQFASASSNSNWRMIAIDDFLLRGNRISASSAAASVDAGSLHLSAVSVQLDGAVPVSATTAWRASEDRWSIRGRLKGTLAMLEFEQEMLGPYPATGSGTIQLLRRIEPLVDATIQWPDWRTGTVQPKSGQFQVEGYPGAYKASFTVQVSVQDEHSVSLKGTASGDTTGLSALNMTVDSAIGQLHAEGSLRWLPSLASVLRVNGQGLDLSQIVAVPQTDIGVDVTIEIEDQADILFAVHSLDGTYNDERFRAQGKLARADQEWRCDQCKIDIGVNRGSVQGSITDKSLALTASIAAPQLNQLWPGLNGAMTLDGSLRGTMTAPVFTGRTSGNSLSWSGWQVARFSINSRASTTQHLDLNASIEDLRRDDQSLGSFDITLNGDLADLDSRVFWELSDFSTNATGALDLSSDYVQGSVKAALFNHAKTGTWQLNNAFRFSSGQGVVDIAAHSWKNGNAELVVNELRIADDETRISAKLDRLPLEILQPAMPANFEISGYANSDMHLRLSGGEWYGSVNWEQQQTQLRITQLDEQPLDVVIPVAKVDLRLLGTSAEATAAVKVDPGLSATLEVSLAALAANPDIEATLKIDGKDWYWVPAVFPEIDKFEGAVDAEMLARGPLREPNLSGELRWRDGRLIIPALNVPINDIDIVVSGSSAGNAIVKGQARVGDGTLMIDGRFDDLMRMSRSFTVRISGENADVLNWPDYKLSASPDIRVGGSRDGVSVNGRVGIPRAEIAIRQIPEGSVKPSADVTVIGREDQAEAEIPITGQADLVLGKNVHVAALGLDTKLEGQLNISVSEKQQIRADGKLTLVDGVFEAYGQRLTITDGSMLFTGPLDNPFVSVRAIRKIESVNGTVTAGIDLRGPAQNLVASVFSEPTMAESDALSYLVLGRPLEQSTATEGSQLSGAAVALGLRQAARITNQIGQAFGLDQLEVAGSGGSTTALVAGKQVSSRLYVRYAYGVFSQLGSVLLRYRLSRRLTLETSTGETQSMDLLYQVEKP
jgi:translocation and assembly module TamB